MYENDEGISILHLYCNPIYIIYSNCIADSWHLGMQIKRVKTLCWCWPVKRGNWKSWRLSHQESDYPWCLATPKKGKHTRNITRLMELIFSFNCLSFRLTQSPPQLLIPALFNARLLLQHIPLEYRRKCSSVYEAPYWRGREWIIYQAAVMADLYMWIPCYIFIGM